MKKLLSVALLLMLSVATFAQTEVTKFLGIPVDGTKSAMIQKLKAKGFQYDAEKDRLTGEFNGRDVNVHVVTNNNKVYRIMVADENYISEGDIKIRFNTLVSQFERNKKYERLSDDPTLSEKENISYEMTVHNKRYQASYYQVPPMDSVQVVKEMLSFALSKYKIEELSDLTNEKKAELAFDFMLSTWRNYSVWFMIDERFGKYGILMYYDNGFNQSNGEDL